MTNRLKLIKKAFTQYGITELSGTVDNNPEILKYFKSIGESWVKTDETAWCSAFINWVCKELGLEYSGKLTARSWLTIGTLTDYPELGDIVILWRESKDSWKGHVGFYINSDNKYIYILGGNQNNKVCIKPYLKSRLLEYRTLIH
jgi:uncharacterized protein (TIGR02594 family)